MAENDLIEFLRRANRNLAEEYERIRQRTVADPGTAGDQGEENWKALLKEWLPRYYEVVTKGRIMGPDGTASGQVDVLVLSPTYPKAMIDTKLYLAGGVVAAFECKTTLRAGHIAEFFDNCLRIKALTPRGSGTPRKELQAPIIYGLLAHSHEWKAPNSSPADNIQRALDETDLKVVREPRNMPDLVCVADVGVWKATKFMLPGTRLTEPNPRGLDISTCYSAFLIGSGQPAGHTCVGSFLTALYGKMAWDDFQMRSLSGYFDRAATLGNGGASNRRWSEEFLSPGFTTELGKNRNRLSDQSSYHDWYPVVH